MSVRDDILEMVMVRLRAAQATLDEASLDDKSQHVYSRAQIAAYRELLDRMERYWWEKGEGN